MLASTSWLHLPPEKRKIGFIFQDYALFPHINVFENIVPIEEYYLTVTN